jgi:hypothetical protein
MAILTSASRLAAPSDLRARSSRRAALVVVIALLLALLVWLQRSGLQNASFTTGYALFAAVVSLIALHWRKQAPSLPLGKISVWLQHHVYLGYLTIVLFALHINFSVPTGVFETVLFTLFIVVAGSGLYGLYISRTLPRQLRVLPEEVVYEKIPSLQRQVMEEARQIILSASDSSALTDFYKTKLAPFLERPRGLAYFLYPNSRRRRLLTGQLHELHRFLSEPQVRDCRQLERLLGRKDDLDFHRALQGRLKLWMFVHIGCSYSLLLLGAVHGVIAHAFQGGVR